MSSIVSCTLRILCVICFVKSILTDENNDGLCPNITSAQDFTFNTLMGHWYGIKRRNFKDVRCLEQFVPSVVERNMTFNFLYGDMCTAEVRQNLIAISNLNDPATVDVYLIKTDQNQFWGTWVFIYADYSRCFVVVRCQDITGTEVYDGMNRHKASVIVYCRNSHPSDEDLKLAYDEIKKQGLHTYDMKSFDQDNCSR